MFFHDGVHKLDWKVAGQLTEMTGSEQGIVNILGTQQRSGGRLVGQRDLSCIQILVDLLHTGVPPSWEHELTDAAEA